MAVDAEADRARSMQSISGIADDNGSAIKSLNDSLAKGPARTITSHEGQLNPYIIKIADESSG